MTTHRYVLFCDMPDAMTAEDWNVWAEQAQSALETLGATKISVAGIIDTERQDLVEGIWSQR